MDEQIVEKVGVSLAKELGFMALSVGVIMMTVATTAAVINGVTGLFSRKRESKNNAG